MKLLILPFIVLFTGFFLIQDAEAQLSEPRQSPIGMTRIMMDDTYIKIVYGRPSVREREIFGGLVPYGEIWRTGANEATEITTTSDIIIGGEFLDKGTYSIFTIPKEDEWTIIVNRGLGMWGNYTYESSLDVFQITAPVQMVEEPVEMFTITLESENDDDGIATLRFEWDDVLVEIPVEL